MKKPLVIFDNLIFSLQLSGGISTVWSALIDRVLRSQEVDCLFMEYPGAMSNNSRKVLNIPSELILHRMHPVPLLMERLASPKPGNYNLKDGRSLSSIIRDRKVIFHSPYYRTLDAKVMNIVTTHDFIHERYSVSDILRRKMHIYLKRRALRNADKIACVSAATQRDLSSLYPECVVKSVVINNGISTEYLPNLENQYKDYLLYISVRSDYKRFDLALRIARVAGLKLLVCGQPINVGEKKLADGVDVRVESNVPPDRIMMLMKGAIALLYTSEYEGFGLPIIEAQAVGCPVIISSSLNTKEIANGAIALSDYSDDEILKAIRQLQIPASRSQIIADGFENAAKYTADEMSRRYLDIYQDFED